MQSTSYSCHILIELEFSRQFFEKYSNVKFNEIRQVGAESFHADGRRDVTKLIVTFRNFENAPKCSVFTDVIITYKLICSGFCLCIVQWKQYTYCVRVASNN